MFDFDKAEQLIREAEKLDTDSKFREQALGEIALEQQEALDKTLADVNEIRRKNGWPEWKDESLEEQ